MLNALGSEESCKEKGTTCSSQQRDEAETEDHLTMVLTLVMDANLSRTADLKPKRNDQIDRMQHPAERGDKCFVRLVSIICLKAVRSHLGKLLFLIRVKLFW